MKGLTLDSPFSKEMFEEVDMGWSSLVVIALHTNLGRFTVVDKLIGFGWRDVETGDRDPNGE